MADFSEILPSVVLCVICDTDLADSVEVIETDIGNICEACYECRPKNYNLL